MSACCETANDRPRPNWLRGGRGLFAWALPSVTLFFVPKCPACLAGYVLLWTGLGVSLATATYLRWGLLSLCGGALFILIVARLARLGTSFRYFKMETDACRTK